MTDRPVTLEQGIAEREALRPERVRNYRVKRAANFTCQHDGCTTDVGVVVVKVGRDGFETRCMRHLGRLRPMPGQWPGRSTDD